MTVANTCNRPMDSMAARLSLDERVFIESSLGAGRSVAGSAAAGPRSTVHRELARCAAGGRRPLDVGMREGATRANAHSWRRSGFR